MDRPDRWAFAIDVARSRILEGSGPWATEDGARAESARLRERHPTAALAIIMAHTMEEASALVLDRARQGYTRGAATVGGKVVNARVRNVYVPLSGRPSPWVPTSYQTMPAAWRMGGR